jgi:uncharacterized protein YutE (UPF0331/DUF86 family)
VSRVSDPDRFLALLDALRQAVAVVVRYRGTVVRDRLLDDADTQNMVLFAVYRAIQSAIEVGQHVIAERGLPIPSSYREVFTALGHAGVVTDDLAVKLQGWGGLRNVIAHQYGTLEIERIASALYEETGDLERFVAEMARMAVDVQPEKP